MGITDRKLKPVRPLVRPSPMKGESLRGYLMRIGECNGYDKRANLYSALTGTQGSSCQVSEKALDNVARSLGLTLGQVDSIAYRKSAHGTETSIVVFGHVIYKGHLRNKHPAVCPQCLTEANAVSGLWDFHAVCACPTHGQWLVDVCPHCCKPLKWMRTRVAICNCGFDLRKARAGKAPEDVLALTSLIHEQVLGDLPTFLERPLKFPEALRHSLLSEILALARYAANEFVSRHGKIARSNKAGSPEFLKYCNAVVLMANLLRNWPDQLPDVLATCGKACDDGSHASDVLTYGQFRQHYGSLIHKAVHGRTLATQVPEFFREVMERFPGAYCVGSPPHGRYLNPALTWCQKDGQRVLRKNSMLAIFSMKREASNPIIPFSEFIKEKERRAREEEIQSAMFEAPRSTEYLKLSWEKLQQWNQSFDHKIYRRRDKS